METVDIVKVTGERRDRKLVDANIQKAKHANIMYHQSPHTIKRNVIYCKKKLLTTATIQKVKQIIHFWGVLPGAVGH